MQINMIRRLAEVCEPCENWTGQRYCGNYMKTLGLLQVNCETALAMNNEVSACV